MPHKSDYGSGKGRTIPASKQPIVDAHVPMPVPMPERNLTYRGADRTKASVGSPPNAKMGR